MGTGYLIDSNVVIDFFNKSLTDGGRKLVSGIYPAISIITFIEIFASNRAAESEFIQLKNFSDVAVIYDIDRNVALEAIELRKTYKIKLPDALIAATALHYQLILITRNISDFDKIQGLDIINPYSN